MRRTVIFLMGCIVFSGAIASAQSLGDYAKSVRKEKAQPSGAAKHFDNDNLPKTDHLTVMGQPAAAEVSKEETKHDGDADQPKTDAKEADTKEADKKESEATTSSDKQAPSVKEKDKDENV